MIEGLDAGVLHLEQHLHVGRVEEPEEPGLLGEGDLDGRLHAAEGTWHRVILGAFSRRDEAQAFRARLRDEREVGPILRLPITDPIGGRPTATEELAATSFAVQVASYRRRDLAVDRASRVENETRMPARVVLADLGDLGLWHRVLLGSFSGEDEAEAFRSRLARTREVGPVRRVDNP